MACNMSRRNVIIVSVITAILVGTGLGVLIWWLVTENDNNFTVIKLEGEGIGDLEYTAAFTKIQDVGDMFWWFYPTIAEERENRPIILWLDGITGMPPSYLANLGMIGPFDTNLNRRTNSWIERYNLLFVDAPLGTGFSKPINASQIPKNIDENAEHLLVTLQSFYSVHAAYKNAPLYILGQAHGAQSALALAIKLHEAKSDIKLNGVVLGNGIISPALVLSKLGFYLEELAYIDANGRSSVEAMSNITTTLINQGDFGAAFEEFSKLGPFVNEVAGAVAVNLNHIVEKQTLRSSQDYFGQQEYLDKVFINDTLSKHIMNNLVAPALGVPANIHYDSGREDIIATFKNTFMVPANDRVEYILQNTNFSISIYNGNLDAVSNTPGQLEWVHNLRWRGREEFGAAPRETLVINRLVEGYFRETPRLKFYWINAAGLLTPLDNPAAMNAILPRILI